MMKTKRILILLMGLMILLAAAYSKGSISYPVFDQGEVYMVEWVFRDNDHGNIIGNPDFEPSFDHVTAESFRELFIHKRNELGYDFKVGDSEAGSNEAFLFELLIDDGIVIKYSEGFMIMSLKEYEGNAHVFFEILETVYFTLSPGESEEAFPAAENIQSFEDYQTFYYPGLIDYRFYHEDDYQVHIEDMKMGH